MVAASEDRAARSAADVRPIEADHRAIRSLMERLDGELYKLAEGSVGGEQDTRQLLAEFCRLLGEHLDREEESGVLEQAAIDQPRFAKRIGGLLGEHDEFRGALQGFEVADGTGWPEIRARFIRFRSILSAHEQAENEVLLSVYMDDLGGHH